MSREQHISGRVILMGGGEIVKGDTIPIDDEIRRSFPQGAEFLFVPTAAGDSEAYIKTMHRFFGKQFHLQVLLEKDGVNAAKKKIADADIIYFGGGKTEFLLKLFRRWKLVPLLKRVSEQGTLLVGMSAGAEALSKQYAVKKEGVWKLKYGWGLTSVCCIVHATPTSAKQSHRALREGLLVKSNAFVAIGERAAWDIQVGIGRKLGKGNVWVDGRK